MRFIYLDLIYIRKPLWDLRWCWHTHFLLNLRLAWNVLILLPNSPKFAVLVFKEYAEGRWSNGTIDLQLRGKYVTVTGSSKFPDISEHCRSLEKNEVDDLSSRGLFMAREWYPISTVVNLWEGINRFSWIPWKKQHPGGIEREQFERGFEGTADRELSSRNRHIRVSAGNPVRRGIRAQSKGVC